MDHLIAIQIPTFIFLLLVAFLAGFVDAIAGGGGLLTVPALLTAGLPPHLTLGTNKLAATFGSFTAARICVKKGLFHPKLWLFTIVTTFLGSLLGTLTTLWLSPHLLRKGLPLLILLITCYVWFHRPSASSTPPSSSSHQATGIWLGGILGFYDGFIGPGVGIWWTAAAITFFQVDLLKASGIARFMNFVSNLVSLVTFMLLDSVHYLLGISLGMALMLGAYVGIHSALRWGVALIRPLFLIVVIATAGRLVWLEWL